MMYQDQTDLLRSCQSELSHGEILFSKGYDLEKAMSAMELMDPKMDSGMKTNDETPSLGELLTLEEIPVSSLSVPQLNAITQHISNYFTAWHAGHPVALTIYKCLYFHDDVTSSLYEKSKPESLPRLLHDLTLLVRKCIANIDCGIVQADIYEDEDFYPDKRLDPSNRNSFGWWTPSQSDEEILSSLSTSLKGLIASSSKEKMNLLNQIELLRLEFLIQGCIFSKKKSNLSLASSLIEKALATLSKISTNSLTPPSHTFDDELIYTKRLLGQAPPRKIILHENPHKAIETRLQRLRFVCKIFSSLQSTDSYWFLHLIDQITSSPRVSIYVRSAMILFLRRFELDNGFNHTLDMFVQFGVR